jgi:hypothetical protein
MFWTWQLGLTNQLINNLSSRPNLMWQLLLQLNQAMRCY